MLASVSKGDRVGTPTEPGPDSTPRLATIVVGVDGSTESFWALGMAATIGGALDSNIRAVHVHAHPGPLGISPRAAAEYRRAQAEIDENVAREAGRRLDAYPGRWEFVTRQGHVGHELLAEADEHDADLIIVGHCSHGTLHDALLGSVAASAVHHSRRSILVAIPPAARP